MAINWQEIITSTFAAVGGSVALLGAAAWLIKSAISQGLVLQTETFKANLKAASDQEIERLRSALQMAAVEHQVRFSNLHGKRAEVIAEIYTRALDAYQDGQQFVLVDGYVRDPVKNQEASDKTNKKLLEFYFFTEKHRIYLPQRTCALLETFVHTMRTHVINVSVYGSIETPNRETQIERRDAFRQAYQAFEKEIPAIRTELESEFRKMLGVD